MTKKLRLMMTMLLLAVMGSAWGQVTTYTDELNRDLTGVTGTSYTSWSGKTSNSSAVYAGNSAGGNGSIQLRSSSASGIVSTTSGGRVKKVTVTWNSNTAAERVLDVYVNNTAYTEVDDLFDASKQGTNIGTITKGTSTELSINGDYAYVGLRSHSGAMYLEEIKITWETGSQTETPTEEEWVLTSLSDLTENDYFVIVGTNSNGNFAMINDKGTGSAPTAVSVNIENNKITSKVIDNLKWTLSCDNNGYIFYPNGNDQKWLYCNNSNNGVRVGTGAAKHFSLASVGYLTTTETTDQRYLGIYNSQDWRCYKSATNEANIKNQSFAFYKKVSYEVIEFATDGYKTYVTKNPIDWEATLERNNSNIDVHGYKAIAFSEADGVSLVEFGVENLESVAETDPMYQEPITPAETPMIIMGKQGVNCLVISSVTTANAPKGNLFRKGGDNATTTLKDNGDIDVALYVMQKIDVNGSGIDNYKFYRLRPGYTVPEGKAYLSSEDITLDPQTPPNVNNIKSSYPMRVLVQEDEQLVSEDAGVVDGIGTNYQEGKDNVYYNVNGMRIANPSKGIYIVNGRKVVLK